MFFQSEAVQSLQYGPVVQQINKRCRWLLNFTGKELQQALAQHADLYEGHSIDANALGMSPALSMRRWLCLRMQRQVVFKQIQALNLDHQAQLP